MSADDACVNECDLEGQTRMKMTEQRKKNLIQTMIYTAILVALFVCLIGLILPEGCFYGSTTDWYNQHVTLAETIRKTCLQEKTLASAWISLGGGSNGFQFAYYGYYRPDIIIGCLLPQVPMTVLIPLYALCCYLAAVLLMEYWLRLEGLSPFVAFFGSMLFLLADCFFQTHRQIMFVNYLPFLILALIFLKKRRFALMSVSLTLVYLHSFYYAIACLAVIGWFAIGMLRREDKTGKKKLLFQGVVSVFLSVGMAMMLLLPTFLAILEHRHSGEKATTMADLIVPNAQNLLYSPYGMGLTIICVYLLLLGLTIHEVRWQCALLLAGSLFGVASYILNATLYARGKILIPFVPVVILYCMKIFQKIRCGEVRWQFWPFVLLAVEIFTQRNEIWFAGILFDLIVLCGIAVIDLIWRKATGMMGAGRMFTGETGLVRYLPLLVMPFLIFLCVAAGEGWRGIPNKDASQLAGSKSAELVNFLMGTEKETQNSSASAENSTDQKKKDDQNKNADQIQEEENFTEEELQTLCGNKLYRCDKLTDTKTECNALQFYGQQSANMYSSVTNPLYQNFYYSVVKMPIQINNRTALLEERNPLFAQLMGERYILTTENKMPYGYAVLLQKGKNVIAENPNVLPIAYTTSDTISNTQFEALNDTEKMSALSRYTVAGSGEQNEVNVSEMEQISLPSLDSEDVSVTGDVQIKTLKNGYSIQAGEGGGVLRMPLDSNMKNGTLYFRFDVKNRTENAVIISANGRKNKLSGATAPYPNENDCFSYMLKEKGNDKYISLKLSAGTYDLTDMECYRLPTKLFKEKQVEAMELQPETKWESDSILNGTVTAREDGYFVTSIPMQKGLKLYVDGKETKLEIVNTAFAGAKISAGFHSIDLRFDAPGQKYGKRASLLSAVLFVIWEAGTVLYKKKRKQELSPDR